MDKYMCVYVYRCREMEPYLLVISTAAKQLQAPSPCRVPRLQPSLPYRYHSPEGDVIQHKLQVSSPNTNFRWRHPTQTWGWRHPTQTSGDVTQRQSTELLDTR